MISTFLSQMQQAPAILKDLISKIPPHLHKQRRIPNKWSIHEHACHLADVHSMMIERFQRFKNEKNPAFEPFLPGTSVSDDHLMEMNLATALEQFEKERKELIRFLESFTEDDWANTATHPEYRQYSAEIFLRHIMMHDHLHMYRIEELWLTADAYLPTAK
jgi:uncharacterized damage-inducible protein DinB